MMLSQFYPPIIGGGAIQARSLGIELVARGHDVVVVTLGHRGQAEYELDRGMRVYRVHSSMQRLPRLFSNNERQFAPPFPDPEAMLALRQIIKYEQPQIIHAHNWLVYSFLPLKVWSGARLVVTLHNYDLACAKTTLVYHGSPCKGPGFTKCLGCAAQFYGPAKGIPTTLAHWMMDIIRRNVVDMFLPISQAVATGNGLVGSGLPFQIVPNFMPGADSISCDDADGGGDALPYLAQLPTEDYLLFAGALSRNKGVDVLLRAYAGLTHAPPLVCIGYHTSEWSKLTENAPRNVLFLKNWPRYAVLEAWRRSIIALVPSVWPEPFGLVAIEAMSVGCPIIASRTGGLNDLVVDG
ncbi:MAG TPA: glycosyltransferase family 4 protein, partial [Ktedonobacteraceae bacterium]|nr:glycosyltransferase family 4 protein [Ktedonobacteraceae bacterium]